MTLQQAAKSGIERVRLSHWSNPGDYIKIDIVGDGLLGPWGHLYCPIQEYLGLERPQSFITIYDHEDGYEPYDGPTLEHKRLRAKPDGIQTNVSGNEEKG